MTTLAADKKRIFLLEGSEQYADVPIIVTDIIYEGAAVGESSSDGTARPLVGADVFLGFAVRRCDNAAGAANDRKVRVMTRGTIAGIAVTGVDNINDLGATVYAIDDNSFTLTSSTGHTSIGKLISYDGTSGFGTVYFEATALRSL
jgi:hypothetical protein